MMTKEEYRKELIRMWDSLRKEHRGIESYESCEGVECIECPLYGFDYSCSCALSTVEVYNAVEKWSKEHPKHYVSQFEYEFLRFLENKGYKYIIRSQSDDLLMVLEDEPEGPRNRWEFQGKILHPIFFNDVFKFVKGEDEEPTSIKQVLKNCEVEDDTDKR